MDRRALHIASHPWLCSLVLISLPFSLKLSNIFLALLILNSFSFGNMKHRLKQLRPYLFWIIASALVFLVPAIRSLFEQDVTQAMKVAERKLAFLLVPFAMLSFPPSREKALKQFVWSYSAGILFLSIYVLVDAFIRFNTSHSTDHFFYHQLGAPFQLHAVYFSVLIIANMVLIETQDHFPVRLIYHLWLFLLLLLLSSKLIVALGFILLLRILIQRYTKSGSILSRWIFLPVFLGIVLLVFTKNPLRERYLDLSVNRLHYVSAEQIGEDVYLDGLSLRLLQTRFAIEISKESMHWLWGTGPGSSQRFLDDKYREVHLYAPETENNRGYIGYNFHNQYAETWVQTGILGLIPLLLCISFPLVYSRHENNKGLLAISLLFILFCITESVFERQLGVFSFLILITWFMQNNSSIIYIKEIKPDLS